MAKFIPNEIKLKRKELSDIQYMVYAIRTQITYGQQQNNAAINDALCSIDNIIDIALQRDAMVKRGGSK